MKLRTIKSKIGNKIYTVSCFKEMELIKRACNIPQDSVMFYLSYFKGKQIFLCESYIYVANNTMEYDNNKHEPIISTMELIELYRVKLYRDYPKTLKDTAYEVKIMKDPHYTFTPEEFLFWIDAPCDINHEIDAPYYEVIKFLNGYSKETFRTERYLFYSKRDKDYNFVNYIYAYDLKTEEEIKLYTIDDWSELGENAWIFTPPMELKDVVVDNTDTKLSLYQQRECKKAFLEIAHKINPIFKVKNYWVMELVKRAIQPTLVLHEWSCHRCFCRPKLFGSIWVYDFPKTDEEPSFMIIDKSFSKVVTLCFKEPEYLMKGIYKRGMAKAKLWKLSEDEIIDLIKFFKSPSERTDSDYYKGAYGKYVKSNWQQLIFEYNHNTAGWGWGRTGFSVPPEKDTDRCSDVEALPFDLPIPDYTKLFSKD